VTGDDLRHDREVLGLSQRELGEYLGVPQATIWRWEAGKHPIERPLMLALALEALRARQPRKPAR